MSEAEKEARPDVHFRVSAEIYRKLREQAHEEERSVSNLVARIVHAWCARTDGDDGK